MPAATRHLQDLIPVDPAILRDFDKLGIRSIAQLAKQDPHKMYQRLEQLTDQRQDPCVLDTFCAAVAQARNPHLSVSGGIGAANAKQNPCSDRLSSGHP